MTESEIRSKVVAVFDAAHVAYLKGSAEFVATRLLIRDEKDALPKP